MTLGRRARRSAQLRSFPSATMRRHGTSSPARAALTARVCTWRPGPGALAAPWNRWQLALSEPPRLTVACMSVQTSDIAQPGMTMEFVITKDADSTRDNIVLLSLRRILVRFRDEPVQSCARRLFRPCSHERAAALCARGSVGAPANFGVQSRSERACPAATTPAVGRENCVRICGASREVSECSCCASRMSHGVAAPVRHASPGRGYGRACRILREECSLLALIG